MAKKLYVGNLSYSTVARIWKGCLHRSAPSRVPRSSRDRETGRSKGFGFVEMGTDQEAQAAIQGLNGKDHGGRPLTVNEAQPREERGGGGRGGRGGGYGGGGRGGRY